MNVRKGQHILMVIPGLEMGGAQSNLLRLASEFHRKGQRVTLLDLKPTNRDREYVESLLEPGIPIVSPPFFLRNIRDAGPGWLETRGKLQRGALKLKSEPSWLMRLIRRENVRAVHSHMYLADLYLSRHLELGDGKPVLLSKQCGCYNLIESQEEHSEDSPFKSQVATIFSSLDGVVTMTEQHEQFLSRFSLDPNRRKIYNGIPLPELRPPTPSDSLRCVMCARDEPTKGWEAAILGVIQAHDQGVSTTLDLMGQGEHLDALEQRFGDHPAITFLGAQSNPMTLLGNYDVGMLPSTFKAESLPNTVVEYQASGLATIATAIGEIPNLVCPDGRHAGILLQPDSQSAMGENIRKALAQYAEDEALLKDHQHAARELRGRFNIRETAQSYLEFQDELT